MREITSKILPANQTDWSGLLKTGKQPLERPLSNLTDEILNLETPNQAGDKPIKTYIEWTSTIKASKAEFARRRIKQPHTSFIAMLSSGGDTA